MYESTDKQVSQYFYLYTNTFCYQQFYSKNNQKKSINKYDDKYDDVKVVLDNKAIKLFQIQVMTHLQELKIQKNQLRKFQQKILPFYLKRFVINLLKNDSQTEITQIKSLFRPHQLNVGVLITLFQNKKNGQIIWKDKLCLMQQKTLVQKKLEQYIYKHQIYFKGKLKQIRIHIVSYVKHMMMKKQNHCQNANIKGNHIINQFIACKPSEK
ncbi:hypothetical protein pb186bvf_009414 [Paramecium bursaria]